MVSGSGSCPPLGAAFRLGFHFRPVIRDWQQQVLLVFVTFAFFNQSHRLARNDQHFAKRRDITLHAESLYQ